MIHCTRTVLPNFDPDPGRTRSLIGGVYVEWSGAPPTEQEVADHLDPPLAVRQAQAEAGAGAMFADANQLEPSMVLLRRVVNSVNVLAPRLNPANLTTVTALTSGLTHFVCIGGVPFVNGPLTLRCNVTTALAGVGAGWAEVAVFRGPLVVGGNAVLRRVGFANVAAVFNSTGRKSVSIPLSENGGMFWLAYGSQAATPFQLRGVLADDLQLGIVQTAAVRPSLASMPQATTLAAANLVPGQVVGVV